MVYLKANLWKLKMYTPTVFEKRARQPMLEKYFRKSKHLG
jgi:hypothetical protein